MKKLLSLLLVFFLSTVAFGIIASAGAASSKEVKRAIAIVFDNSGSMYIPDGGNNETRRAWCRATYAMEAFATMMNKNDVMQIYPMHPITVGTEEYSSENPLTVTQSTAVKIRDIYTPTPKGTPIETIATACEGLTKVDADERWLIVLTDGAQFYKNGIELSRQKTVEELEGVLSECRQQVNIMYLGIGEESALPQNVIGSYQYHAERTKSSTEVLSVLTSMCNMIFGRDILPNTSQTISFDVSMSKLILFVQGSGITNVKLGDKMPSSVNDMKYATLGGGGQAAGQFWTDETLQGTMVFYNDLDAGDYTLTYEGMASSVVCYYEPSVDLSIELRDKAGNVIDPKEEITAGEYSLYFNVVDKYGVPTNSSLLGSTRYEIIYSINGEEKSVVADEAGKIDLELEPKDVLDGHFKLTYLGGYTITRTSEEFGWLKGGLTFSPLPAGELTAEISGGASSYNLSQLPEGEKFRISFFYEGSECTGGQLDRIEQLQATIEGGNVKCTLNRDDQGYYVELDYAGSAKDTQCGDYVLKVSGVYRNEDELLTNVAIATVPFSVVDDGRVLEMEVIHDQDYYQISKIADGEPIILKFSFSGQPLTAEELEALQLNYVAEGIKLIVEKDPTQSAYILRFDAENSPEKGKYEIRVSASGVNETGNEMTIEGSTDAEFGLLPMWLRLLMPFLIILLILLIIWAIMNMKVLPKVVYIKAMEMNVDGELISIKTTPKFNGAGKNKGTLIVSSPKVGTDPMAEQSISLTLSAVSPRRTPSKQRKALVTNASLRSPNNIIYWRIKGAPYEPDPEKPGGFVHALTGKPGFKEMEIGGTTEIEIQAETEYSSVIFRCELGFK